MTGQEPTIPCLGDSLLDRPRTRGECFQVPRPCPHVSCSYNLYLDVDERSGQLKLNSPGLDPDEVSLSCALDVAGDGPRSLEEVGELLGVSRERIRQIEEVALSKLQRRMIALEARAPLALVKRRRVHHEALRKASTPKIRQVCSQPGCGRHLGHHVSVVQLPGADMSKCADHRAEALGLNLKQYRYRLAILKGASK
jgi:hypothetical protein